MLHHSSAAIFPASVTAHGGTHLSPLARKLQAFAQAEPPGAGAGGGPEGGAATGHGESLHRDAKTPSCGLGSGCLRELQLHFERQAEWQSDGDPRPAARCWGVQSTPRWQICTQVGMAEDHWAEAPLAPESPEPQEREPPTIFHQFGDNPDVPPEWDQPVWPPLPPFPEAVRQSEAFERQYEERLLRIHVARALMCVQFLEAHNRLLQHLLIQERKTGHCPEDASGHCPHPTRLVQKYNVNARPGKNIIKELSSSFPEPRRFAVNMEDMSRAWMLNQCDAMALVQFTDVRGDAAHDACHEMTLISDGAIASLPVREGGPLFTPGIEEHDPTDPRNYEEDSPVSAPLFPDAARDGPTSPMSEWAMDMDTDTEVDEDPCV